MLNPGEVLGFNEARAIVALSHKKAQSIKNAGSASV
jgi:hypothetical protein